jgi:hypothetical protein
METPTTVKIDGDGSWLSFVLAGKFLQLGYNIIPESIPQTKILDHKQTYFTGIYHSHFIVAKRGVALHVLDTGKLYLFQLDPDNLPASASEICEFIIGTWGTIRGNRCKYDSNLIDITRETMNDWRVI